MRSRRCTAIRRICVDGRRRRWRHRGEGRSSAAIDGGGVELRRDGDYDDPLLAGAMRVAQALDGDSWFPTRRCLPAGVSGAGHMLAAADLVADADDLGRPRPDPM